jgi:UDP-N-acetylglucosamine 4,6-dehydratase/5-epimerase
MQNFLNNRPNFNNKTILITGGTGSFGMRFVEKIIKMFKPKKLIIFSRDELKQYEMSKKFSPEKYGFIRYFIGDIRDLQRLEMALTDVDFVVHAAALKHVESSEYNPYECVQTNIVGAQNLVIASLKNKVKKLIFLSTDKACSPLNLYGASKLAAEKIFIAANNIKGKDKTIFSNVRYGNVFGSRGSVIHVFNEAKKNKKNFLPITHKDMTRFFITLDQGVNFVLSSISMMEGGEIFVPKIFSFKITDVAKIAAPNSRIKFIGIRPGEKLHEILINADESKQVIETKDRFIIMPYFKVNINKNIKYKKLIKPFDYKSNNNNLMLNLSKLKIFFRNQ